MTKAAKKGQSIHNDDKNSPANLINDFAKFSQEAKTQDQYILELAHRIAKELDDEKNLGLYINYCRNYPLSIIHYAFEEAMRRRPEEIKKSRGALFTYIVQFMTKGRNRDV